jgi:phosphatidylinositol 4-phosphatase
VNYRREFAFNHWLLQEFKDVQYAPFRVPCIYGYVAVRKINARTDLALVSRKDCRRVGRSHISRGLDKEGNCANFCENEVILSKYCQNLK